MSTQLVLGLSGLVLSAVLAILGAIWGQIKENRRETAKQFESQNLKLDGLVEDVTEIRVQTTRTNGRVDRLEDASATPVRLVTPLKTPRKTKASYRAR